MDCKLFFLYAQFINKFAVWINLPAGNIIDLSVSIWYITFVGH